MSRRIYIFCATVFLTASAASGVAQEPQFTLGFDAGSGVVRGRPGIGVTINASATLTTDGLGAGDPGAQAWQTSLSVDGCSLINATTEGTIVDDFLNIEPQFISVEVVDPFINGQGQGVVSAVALALQQVATLPPTGTVDLLRMTLRSRVPSSEDATSQCTLAYVDGFQGPGRPVSNRVTWGAESFTPAVDNDSGVVTIEPIVDCSDKPIALIFQNENTLQTPDLNANRHRDTLNILGDVGERPSGTAYIGIVSQLPEGRGVAGWSLSLGSENIAITGATTAGTVGDTVMNGGIRQPTNSFDWVDLADPVHNDGRSGVVAATVLSYMTPVTLDSSGTATVLRVDFEAAEAIPESGVSSGELRFSGGLRTGNSQDVANVAGVDGQSRPFCAAEQQSLDIRFIDCATQPLQLIFQDRSSGQEPDRDANRIETLEVQGRLGERATGTVYVGIASQLPAEGGGVQAWSLSLAADGLTPMAATTDGTVAADFRKGGLMRMGFNYAETVDPALNGGQRGAVTAVVLSYQMPITLEPEGSATILQVDFESDEPLSEEDPQSGSFRFVEDLVGREGSQPVPNTVAVAGEPRRFCAPERQEVEINFVPLRVGQYLPGDANADGGLNIADAIWLISELFRMGPAAPCPDARDANDDDMVDLSDAVWVIEYQFLGGSAPPQGTECILDPESTADSCPFGSTPCDV